MRAISFLILTLIVCSCSQNINISETENNISDSKPRFTIIDGVVYPSTDFTQKTRISFDDADVDWVNGTQVKLSDGQSVDLPWVDGGSLPFYMQQKLSPDNGWELIAHTMYPNTQENRNYLIFHNYITGTLRVFCYMTSFVTNNNGYWKISFSEPTRLLNFTSEVSDPLDIVYKDPTRVISNSTTQDGKGFALGWNGFQIELSYDPNVSGIMKIEAMNMNSSTISMTGDLEASTEGTITGTTTSSSTIGTVVKGVGKLAGEAASKWIEKKAGNINIPNLIKTNLASMAKGGVSAIFSSFSGLFDKKSQVTYDVNFTTHGDFTATGTSITQTAAPIVPVNIHLENIDTYLGAWNIETTPELQWYTTIYNDMETNKNVNDREYYYQVPGVQNASYKIVCNPKAYLPILSAFQHRTSNYYDYTYKNEGNMPFGCNAMCSAAESPVIYPYGKTGSAILDYSNVMLRVRVAMPEYETSENLPFELHTLDAMKKYSVREYSERKLMNVFLQVSAHSTFTINGVENEYYCTRTYKCIHNWGSEY